MAKKDNKSHHDKSVRQNINRQEHANSFIQRRDPRLNTQEIAEQNLAQNHQDGNYQYRHEQLQKAEAAKEFDQKDFKE